MKPLEPEQQFICKPDHSAPGTNNIRSAARSQERQEILPRWNPGMVIDCVIYIIDARRRTSGEIEYKLNKVFQLDRQACQMDTVFW